jgi:hypothetical protein
MLAAAQLDSAEAGEQFTKLLRANQAVDWAFYKLPDLSQLGLSLFAVALWRQGPGWRVSAAVVTLAALVFLSADWVGPLAVRVGLGLMFAGFLTVAWKIATRRPEVNGC